MEDQVTSGKSNWSPLSLILEKNKVIVFTTLPSPVKLFLSSSKLHLIAELESLLYVLTNVSIIVFH